MTPCDTPPKGVTPPVSRNQNWTAFWVDCYRFPRRSGWWVGTVERSGSVLSIFTDKHVSNPHHSDEVEDSPESWADLLDNPRAIPDDPNDDSKEAAPVLCGARYLPEASSREKENIEGVYWLLLDVDALPIPEIPLRAALSGSRAIVYTSPSHTTAFPRWRVLMPLASPLPAKKYRSLIKRLSEVLFPGYEGCINVGSTGDPGRLGFVTITKHPEDYLWFISEGDPLDWTEVTGLEDEVWNKAPLGGLERSPLWSDRATALKAALRFFAKTGQGMSAGSGRTVLFWSVSNQLWWEWAAEDEAFVLEVLQQIDANFTESEDTSEMTRQMAESHKITIGQRRKGQLTGSYGWRRDPTSVITKESISSHATRLIHRRNPEDQAKGLALRRLAKGHTLSDEHQARKGLVTKLVHELTKVFQTSSAERISEIFTESVSAMSVDVPTFPTMDEVRSWIGAGLERQRKFREENMRRADAKVTDQIEYVMGGERSTKYTSNEVSVWEQSVGLRENNWILVTKNVFFVFRNGTWVGPYTEKEFDAQGYKDLAAAADVGVRTQTENKQKEIWTNTPLQKLLHEYGSRCMTRVDLNCDKTWFDVDEKVLVLAGPPKRALVAKFHEDVDQWFRVMTSKAAPKNAKSRQMEAATSSGDDDYDVLCDWLASVTQLDRPCAALYLQGVHSVGKGLFAEGVARIWKAGAMPLEDVFDDFNSLLSETPFVWIDEALPEHVRASTLLRKAIAAREFVYKRKYMDAGKMTGCLRMLFTANNLDLFNKAKEMVKKEDVDALAQRFVHILVNTASVTYLESISPRHEDFVEKNFLAEHAYWLHEKRWSAIKARGLRFLVKGRNTNVSDVVATNSDSTSDCCNSICEAVVEQRKTDWLLVKDGEVWVNTSLLKRYLSTQNAARWQYSEVEITRAVSSISMVSKQMRHGKQMRMRSVRLESLKAWCDNKEVYDWLDVKGGLIEMSKATTARETVSTSSKSANAEKQIVN